MLDLVWKTPEMTLVPTWEMSGILSIVAIIFSAFFSALTLILNRREKPSLMPYGNNVCDGDHLVLDFNNTGDINLHEVSILINGYDSEFSEISSLHFQDKFLFTISAKSKFNYGFNLGAWSSKDFYFRVRLKGKYFSRFPLFPALKFEQVIWYSAIVRRVEEAGASIKISTTHRDEISRLESKYWAALEKDEKTIDEKFKN